MIIKKDFNIKAQLAIAESIIEDMHYIVNIKRQCFWIHKHDKNVDRDFLSEIIQYSESLSNKVSEYIKYMISDKYELQDMLFNIDIFFLDIDEEEPREYIEQIMRFMKVFNTNNAMIVLSGKSAIPREYPFSRVGKYIFIPTNKK